MRSWIESFGRASSAPPRRSSLIPGRTSFGEIFEQPRLKVGRPHAARTGLEHAPNLCAPDVDPPPWADALQLAGPRPSSERAPADGDVRRREDGGGFAER